MIREDGPHRPGDVENTQAQPRTGGHSAKLSHIDPKTKATKDANKISAIKWMSLVVNCSHLQGWGGEGGKAGEVKDIGNALSLVCAPRSWA